MTQDPEHRRYACPLCHATVGKPCVGPDGQERAEVHWNRPYWSSRVRLMVLPQQTFTENREAIQAEWLQQVARERELTEIERLRFRMPVLNQRNSDAEMLLWGRALARAERDD